MARVAGLDVVREAAQVRAAIGLIGQQTAVDDVLTGRQNLALFGRLLHLGSVRAGQRAAELLERFGLTEAADRPVSQYSGGMRRRLDLAAGLILAPRALFLDEPTTGLDPHGRAEMWAAVRGLVADGTTVLLTTQYLDEADQLADDIKVIAGGRLIASGSPAELKAEIGGDHLDVVLRDADRTAEAAAILARLSGHDVHTDPESRRVSAPVDDRIAVLTDLIRALDAGGIEVEDLALRRPTLDEVFLRLTSEVAA
jgi:ABC-2 type transport system ATP-binding protein